MDSAKKTVLFGQSIGLRVAVNVFDSENRYVACLSDTKTLMLSVMETNPTLNNKTQYENALKAGKSLISSLQTGGDKK